MAAADSTEVSAAAAAAAAAEPAASAAPASSAAPADGEPEAADPKGGEAVALACVAADAPAAEDLTLSEEELREKRIQECAKRGDAPIKLEFLIQVESRLKRKADAEVVATEGQQPSAEQTEEPPSKRKKGMNRNKDRSKPNTQAWKNLRASQLCTRLAYQNECHLDKDGQKCKFNHDLDVFFAQKPAELEQTCPVFEKLGVCPAGLNCRFQGHITDRKNIDRDGNALSPQSEWLKTVSGIGNPPGETNIFDFEIVGQLRKKIYDFSRSAEINKAWQRYCSGNCDEPLGGIVIPERRSVDLKGKTILAPLTTVGNLPYRRLCVGLGCEVTVGEMALSQSVLEGSPAELSLLRRHESEKCFGIQVAGGDVEVMTRLAQFADEQVDCDFVDINCGCPLDELHKRGAGTRLMARTKCLEGVVRCMSTALRTKPLTLKFRTADHVEKRGDIEFDGRYAHKLVPKLEEWGVSALTLHGRTARQSYRKLADWSYIQECTTRRTMQTPFIACGDVMSYVEAEEHLNLHGVDSIMLGRGALIKPWIFTEIAERRHWDISASERLDLVKDFCHYGLEHWGADARGVENTRRFLLEWLSFTCRYIPLGLLDVLPQKINWRLPAFVGRSDLETKLSSGKATDWIDISEMFLGKVPDGFSFVPKHKSASTELVTAGATEAPAAQDVQG